jgi:ankyrin repeat protein
MALTKQQQKLHDAAASGDLDTFKTLIANGHYCADDYGVTPSMIAAENGHNNILSYLAKNYPFYINDLSVYGVTPVYCAAAKGRLATVKFLVEHSSKANLQLLTINSSPPLRIAIEAGYPDVVEYLLSQGIWAGLGAGLDSIIDETEPKILAIKERIYARFPQLRDYPDAPFSQYNLNANLEELQHTQQAIQGNCHGLSVLWAYARLQGQAAKFFADLSRASKAENLDVELQQFVENVTYIQNPERHVSQLDIDILIKNTKNDNSPNIKSEYQVSGIFLPDELAHILSCNASDGIVQLRCF